MAADRLLVCLCRQFQSRVDSSLKDLKIPRHGDPDAQKEPPPQGLQDVFEVVAGGDYVIDWPEFRASFIGASKWQSDKIKPIDKFKLLDTDLDGVVDLHELHNGISVPVPPRHPRTHTHYPRTRQLLALTLPALQGVTIDLSDELLNIFAGHHIPAADDGGGPTVSPVSIANPNNGGPPMSPYADRESPIDTDAYGYRRSTPHPPPRGSRHKHPQCLPGALSPVVTGGWWWCAGRRTMGRAMTVGV